MAIKTKLCGGFSLATLLTLAMMLWMMPMGSAQTTPAANPPTAEPAPLPTPPTARPVGPTPRPAPPYDDITAREVAEMNQFLDSHPEIAEQLRKDPSLVDNQRWVADHPALQAYLQQHPRVADAFRTNPNLFMRIDEGGYNRDVADMNRFLQSHPEIAEQLRRDPRLIDNRDWVANHPALQEYLQTHPQVTAAFRADPGAFMQDENRDMRDDITRADVTEMGRFLASHPEINEQLRKDPSLIDNRKWVSDHPALQEYLQSHPQVADAFRADPGVFMRDEERYDRQNGDHPFGLGDRNRGELASFGQFLGGHTALAAELSNNPTLANNKEYLATHPELDEYLKAHPTVGQQLAENPQAVMNSDFVQKNGSFSAKPAGTPKNQ